MARYAIAFDMDTKLMTADGVTKSERTGIYQTEIPGALEAAGFTHHSQGSVYMTDEVDLDRSGVVNLLKRVLIARGQNFWMFYNRVHIFRVEDWSDVTEALRT